MVATFDDVLKEPSVPLDLAVELDYYDPSTETTGTFYASLLGRPADDPVKEPLLIDAPGLALDLSKDEQLSGLVQGKDPGRIVLINPNRPDSNLDYLVNLDFAGRGARVKRGAQKLAYAAYETRLTTTTKSDPSVTSERITFELETPTEALEVPLLVRRFIGIPTCLALSGTNKVTITQQTYYDLESFTVMGRYRSTAAAVPNEYVDMLRKVGGTVTYFWLCVTTSGYPRGQVYLSDGSVVILTGSTSIADQEWHSLIFAVDGQREAYLVVDGETVDSVSLLSSEPADTTTANLYIGNSTALSSYVNDQKVMDVRYYGGFVETVDALAELGVPNAVDDLDLVGHWRCDDGSSTTVTDYSDNGNDGTLDSAEWDTSFEGDPFLAGEVHPLALGWPLNVKAVRQSESRHEYRMSDGSTPKSGTTTDRPVGENVIGWGDDVSLFSRGVEIADTLSASDWELADSTLTHTSTGDEPTTCKIHALGAAPNNYRFAENVLDEILAQRGPLTATDTGVSSDVHTASWNRFVQYLKNIEVGLFVDREQTSADLTNELLSGLGAYIARRRDGEYAPGILLPPLSPSPFGESVVDHSGIGSGDGTVWSSGTVGDTTTDYSIMFWLKRMMVHGNRSPGSAGRLVAKTDGPGAVWANRFYLPEDQPSTLALETWDYIPPSTYVSYGFSVPGVVPWMEWVAFLLTYDDSSGAAKCYRLQWGEEFKLIYSGTWASGMSALNEGNLHLAAGHGAMCQYSVWNTILDPIQATALIHSQLYATESGLTTYVPLEKGDSEEKVNSVSPSTENGEWVPQITVDLDAMSNAPSPEITRIAPSKRATVYYDRTWRVMQDQTDDASAVTGDFAGAVSEDAKNELSREWKRTSFPSLTDRVPGNAIERVLYSAVINEADAVRVSRRMGRRFSVGRGILRLLAGRSALKAEIGDEVLVKGSRFGLWEGQQYEHGTFRCVGFSDTIDKIRLLLWGDVPDARKSKWEEAYITTDEAGTKLTIDTAGHFLTTRLEA